MNLVRDESLGPSSERDRISGLFKVSVRTNFDPGQQGSNPFSPFPKLSGRLIVGPGTVDEVIGDSEFESITWTYSAISQSSWDCLIC